jgi:uncharacterized protein (TIGR02265 family)
MEVAEFREPDWTAPIDLAELLAQAPAEQSVKGLFFASIVARARAASGVSPGRPSYATFQDYPLREWLELLIRAAELTHPREPVREGLRRLGRGAYAAFTDSVIGKVLVSTAGGDVGAVLRQLPRIYRVSGNTGTAEVSFIEPARAIIHLRDIWDFPDAYQVGIYEGGLAALGATGHVRVRTLGLSGADLEVTWRRAGSL